MMGEIAVTEGQQAWSAIGAAAFIGACAWPWQSPAAIFACGIGVAADSGTGARNASDKIRTMEANNFMYVQFRAGLDDGKEKPRFKLVARASLRCLRGTLALAGYFPADGVSNLLFNLFALFGLHLRYVLFRQLVGCEV